MERARPARARGRRTVSSSMCSSSPASQAASARAIASGPTQSSSSGESSISAACSSACADAGVAPARADGGQHQQALEPRRGRVSQLPGEPDRDLRRLVEAALVQLRAHLQAKDRQRPQIEVVLGAMAEAGLDVGVCQRVRPVQHRADRQVVVCPRDLLLQPVLPGHLERRASSIVDRVRAVAQQQRGAGRDESVGKRDSVVAGALDRALAPLGRSVEIVAVEREQRERVVRRAQRRRRAERLEHTHRLLGGGAGAPPSCRGSCTR